MNWNTVCPFGCWLQGLADKYDTNTASIHVKMCVFLRRSVQEHGLKDPSIVACQSPTGAYGSQFRLDTARLLAEGVTTWDAFAAAYLGVN